MSIRIVPRTLVLICLGVLPCGCSSDHALDPAQVDAHRARLMLDDEPAGAVGVPEAREAVAGEAEDIVVFGMICAGAHAPWDPQRAAFMISDPAVVPEDHGDGHDHDHPAHDPNTCPFCTNEKSVNDQEAMVQCVDKEGRVIAIGAQQLLGLEEHQFVVVQGRGEINSLGMLVVSATGIYVRE
jgi:hypothetical protein